MSGVDRERERALSFGARAELYHRVRPAYPPAAVSLLLDNGPGRAGRARVADVGAGTGKLTAGLVAAGLDVVAVEPDPGMRAVLARQLPDVEVRDGRGEALGLAGGSLDVVVYGQAWHWVEATAAAAEATRVLRPDGVLAMLWNVEVDSTPWAVELDRLVGLHSQSRDALPPPPELAGFAAAQVRRLAHTREQDVAALPDYALSHSSVAVLPGPERDGVLCAVRRLAAEHPELRGRERVEVAMQTLCWTYRRAG